MTALYKRIAAQRIIQVTVLTSLSLFAGCAQIQQGSTSNAPNGPTASVAPAATVAVCDAANSNCQTTSPSASVSSSPDINIAVGWTQVPSGNHSQEIRIVMPNGDIYQRLQHSFLIESGAAGSAHLTENIPIAGTFISQRQITGAWKVEVSLDGAATTTQDLQMLP